LAWFLCVASLVLKVVPPMLVGSYFDQPDTSGWMIVILGPVLGVLIPIWMIVLPLTVIVSMGTSLMLMVTGRMRHGLPTLGITAGIVFTPLGFNVFEMTFPSFSF